MGLYDIMVAVLKEHKAMTASQLGEYIRENELCKQKDGTPIKNSQIHARVNNRPDLFVKVDGKIMLFDPETVIKPKNITKKTVVHNPKNKINTLFGNIVNFAPNPKDDWFHESNISKTLVDYLFKQGFKIIKDNNNLAAKGIDIIAEKDGKRELIEVKGYPSIFFANGKPGIQKTTTPYLQSTHWFDGCLSSTIKNYETTSDVLAMAFPACARYEELMYVRQAFFADHNMSIKIYFIKEDGSVVIDNINRKFGISREQLNMKKKDERNLGDTFIASDIKVSDITQEEAHRSWIDSFSKGLSYLSKKLSNEIKRKKT